MPVTEQAPNLTISNSPTVGAGVRTGIQVVSGAFLVEGVEVFNLYDFTELQAKWLTAALTITLAFLQNFIERRRNQKFIGAAPTPAVRPEGGYVMPDVVIAVLCFAMGVILTKLFWC